MIAFFIFSIMPIASAKSNMNRSILGTTVDQSMNLLIGFRHPKMPVGSVIKALQHEGYIVNSMTYEDGESSDCFTVSLQGKFRVQVICGVSNYSNSERASRLKIPISTDNFELDINHGREKWLSKQARPRVLSKILTNFVVTDIDIFIAVPDNTDEQKWHDFGEIVIEHITRRLGPPTQKRFSWGKESSALDPGWAANWTTPIHLSFAAAPVVEENDVQGLEMTLEERQPGR